MRESNIIKHLRACSNHLDGLGYTKQCVDEFEGTVYILGFCEGGFHMHKLYKVREVGTIKSRKLRIEKALNTYKQAFDVMEII